jgi:rhamnosyltransferase
MSEQRIDGLSPRLSEREMTQQENSAPGAADSVCAIVVAYFPDKEFDVRVGKLLTQVARVVVVDNTPDETSEPRFNRRFHDMAQVHLIENRANLGISVALNQGLQYALNGGFKWILTLDQDTECFPDMVDALIKVSRCCERKATVIGGNYLDLQTDQTKVPVGGAGDFLEQKTVITSGSLIDVRMAAEVGEFRDDYFIDQVDHEFCLRARAHGYQIVISRKVVMTHSVGRPGGVRVPFMGRLPNHPPLRKYYIARNTVVTVAEYWSREPQWCLRRMMRLLLGLGLMAFLEDQRLDKVRAFAGGIVDGLYRRMGPCARESICRTLPIRTPNV